MNRSALKKTLFSAVLAGLLALQAAGPACAADGARPIRAAVYNNSNLAYQDENGAWRGSDIECLINIAQRADLSVEFVDSNADPDFLANLDNGTYDIVCDVVKTPEREAEFAFSERSIGSSATILTVKAGDSRFVPNDYRSYDGMRVGFCRGINAMRIFRNLLTVRGFPISPFILTV